MRKNKRLLSVHPMDFDPEDYLPHSRRQSVQVGQQTSSLKHLLLFRKIESILLYWAVELSCGSFLSFHVPTRKVRAGRDTPVTQGWKEGTGEPGEPGEPSQTQEEHVNSTQRLRGTFLCFSDLLLCILSSRCRRSEVTGTTWTTTCTTTG